MKNFLIGIATTTALFAFIAHGGDSKESKVGHAGRAPANTLSPTFKVNSTEVPGGILHCGTLMATGEDSSDYL